MTDSQLSSVLDLRIAHYNDDRIDDPRKRFKLPSAAFHHARNLILRECRRFGTVGAMDEYPLMPELSEEQADEQWKTTGLPNPDFFVVDDQLNSERYIYVEVHSSALFSKEWIGAVASALGKSPGWGVAVTNLRNGYMILLENIVLVSGPLFAGLKTIDDMVEAAQRNLR
jgi:hypothetical protein